MNVHRRPGKRLRPQTFVLALLFGALIAFTVPAFAAAQDYVVNSTGDAAQKAEAEGRCETEASASECTLRAAIEAANFDAASDVVHFNGSLFNGVAPASTVVLGSALPQVNQPLKIDGGTCIVAAADVPCVQLDGTAIVGQKALTLRADGTVVEHLAITTTYGAVQILGNSGSPSVKILDNTINITGSITAAAIETVGSVGSSGNVIEGNKVTVSSGFHFGFAINNGPNRIFGNELTGGGCCYTAIWVMNGATGNQIGGDTEASENVINGFQNGAIILLAGNEAGRNRGENGESFISGGAVPAPTISTAFQARVSGTTEPGAKVRLFRKATEFNGEIEGFLGEATADGEGRWSVAFPELPGGTFVAATETVSGSTSNLTAATALVEDKGPREQKEREEREARERGEREAREREEREAKEKGGGDTGGGGTATAPSAPAPAPAPAPAAPTAPKVRITSGPKKSSTSTTAKFKFKAEPATGATFQCKLDGARWASCRSPKTYDGLRPGKHTFQVKATVSGLTGAAAKFKFTVKS